MTHYKHGSHRAYLDGCRCATCKEGHARRRRQERAKAPGRPETFDSNKIGECERNVRIELKGEADAVTLAQACQLAKLVDQAETLPTLAVRSAAQLYKLLSAAHKKAERRTNRRPVVYQISRVK
jgi:hypothetical protein